MAENPNWINGKFICSWCGLDGELKASKSISNHLCAYGKCPSKPCSKFIGWLDECDDNRVVESVDLASSPQEDNPELSEIVVRMSEAMLIVYMCKNHVGELVRTMNTTIEEMAIMRTIVDTNTGEVLDSRADMSDVMEKVAIMTKDMTLLKEKVIEMGKTCVDLKEVGKKVVGLMMFCGIGVGIMVGLVLLMLVVVLLK